MKTSYMGLELSNPIIVSSSPYTATVTTIENCAKNGAGAVVLKSIFEEQILHETASMERHSESVYGDADIYLQRYLADDYKARFVELIQKASSKVNIPLIASINCVNKSEGWKEYAQTLEEAGAAAIELNIFLQPTQIDLSSDEIEKHYTQIVRDVVNTVNIPVSVKLPMRLTNVFHLANSLLAYGAKGVVLFNRFFEPDVDIEKVAFVESKPYSEASELRNLLRTSSIFSAVLPQLDLSVSTGVHDGESVVKALLCGAKTVQICSAIHSKGYEVIQQMNQFLEEWCERHGVKNLEEMRGRLNFKEDTSSLSQRVQYMRYFPGK